MNKKKSILLTLVLSAIFVLLGAFLKLHHVACANIFLMIGMLVGFVFLYFLISFLIKAKE